MAATGSHRQATLTRRHLTWPRAGQPGDRLAGRPGPKGRLLVGTLFDYERDPLAYLTSCRDTYGDIFSLTPHHVVICRPDWSHEVFARTNHELRFATNGRTGRESFMTEQVSGWMTARRSAGWRHLGKEGTATTGARLRTQLRDAFERMADLPGAGVPDCQAVAADAAMHVFVTDFDERLRRLVMDAADTIPAITRSSLDLPTWASPGRRKFLRATEALMLELTWLVALRAHQRRGPRSEPADVLDLLCDVRDPGSSENAFTNLQIAQFLASCLTNLYAVTGAVLSWLLVMTAQHHEITDNAGRTFRTTRDPAGADPWREAVVKETLRMHPPIWNLVRQVREPVDLGGYRIEAGTTVVVSPVLMHFDSRWWREDPAEFRPGRWLDPHTPPHERHAYIPYGSGPRICVGAQLAQTILTQALEIVTSSWQVSAVPLVPPEPPTAVVIPDPVRFQFSPR